MDLDLRALLPKKRERGRTRAYWQKDRAAQVQSLGGACRRETGVPARSDDDVHAGSVGAQSVLDEMRDPSVLERLGWLQDLAASR